MKKVLIALMFVMNLLIATAGTIAEETAEEGVMLLSDVSEKDIDNDLLINMYAELLFSYGEVSFYREKHNFSENTQEYYDFLVTFIKEVATGERTSTKFTIEMEFMHT